MFSGAVAQSLTSDLQPGAAILAFLPPTLKQAEAKWRTDGGTYKGLGKPPGIMAYTARIPCRASDGFRFGATSFPCSLRLFLGLLQALHALSFRSSLESLPMGVILAVKNHSCNFLWGLALHAVGLDDNALVVSDVDSEVRFTVGSNDLRLRVCAHRHALVTWIST
jgi:hypothetical protein